MIAVSARRGISPWSRIRGAGAASAVLVLLMTAAMAPFSVPSALADTGRAGFADPSQRLESAASSETLVDTAVTAASPSQSGAAGTGSSGDGALYTLQQFMFSGAVNWNGYRFTFYSQQVLPGPGLQIPGRHVNDDGYVSDGDGYIVLAGSHPKGAVFDTPFGYQGKIYDRGTFGNHLDVYVR